MEAGRSRIALATKINRKQNISILPIVITPIKRDIIMASLTRRRRNVFFFLNIAISLFLLHPISHECLKLIKLEILSASRPYDACGNNLNWQLVNARVHAYCSLHIWGVSRQLSQRAAREPQIVLFLTHVYDTKTYFKKFFDKRFRRIFSSAFQLCRQFFRYFLFLPSKSIKRVISQKVYF